MLWNKRRLLSEGHILVLSPIMFHVTGATRLHVKILSFYGQNLTRTDFDKILMVNLFFFLPMSTHGRKIQCDEAPKVLAPPPYSQFG